MFVAFGDMLGFGSLVLENEDTNTERLRNENTEWARHEQKFKLANASLEQLYDGKDTPSLERQFNHFHRALSRRFDAATFKLESVVFSDSFFIASDDGNGLLAFLPHLMQEMILNLVPIRVGVAEGSFCLNEMKTAFKATSHDFSVQFLGKGVVRAVKAESKGLKGVRVALHSSAIEALNLGSPVAVPVPGNERTNHCEYEFNYLIPFLTDPLDATSMKDILTGIEIMRSVAPDEIQKEHFAPTTEALKRLTEEFSQAAAKPGSDSVK